MTPFRSRTMNNFTSCYKCKDRQVGCHSNCEKYLAERKKYDEEMDVINKTKYEGTDAKWFLAENANKRRRRWNVSNRY